MSKILSAWESYKAKNGVTPLDILNPRAKNLENEISEKRLNVCISCEHLIQLTKQCKKCGCFMPLKTKLEEAMCPIGKW